MSCSIECILKAASSFPKLVIMMVVEKDFMTVSGNVGN